MSKSKPSRRVRVIYPPPARLPKDPADVEISAFLRLPENNVSVLSQLPTMEAIQADFRQTSRRLRALVKLLVVVEAAAELRSPRKPPEQ